jgi:hypothetical protein
MQENPMIRGILVFIVSWFLLGTVVTFYCGPDPTGDPGFDQQTRGRSILLGCSVILCSICLGVLEYRIVRRRNRDGRRDRARNGRKNRKPGDKKGSPDTTRDENGSQEA